MENQTLDKTRSDQILVEIDNLTKIFSRSVWAIKKLNLKIYKQDAIALIGHNGAGKSVLAQLIGNILKQTSGNIDYYFENENIFQAIGYQSREQAWPVGFKVQDVLNLYVTAYEIKDQAWIAKLMDVFAINEILERKLNKLNILSLQLFAIFLVMLYRPELLVIDELSSAIAFEKKMRILNLLKEYRASGGTVILVQPEDFIMNALCNRIVTLNNGELQDDLKINQVLKEYGSTFEYVRRLSVEARNNQKRLPINRSFEILFQKYRTAQQSLETVYRTQFNNQLASPAQQEIDVDIRNAIYYVNLGYEHLYQTLNEKTSKKTISETTKLLKKTVKILRRTLNEVLNGHFDSAHDVRFKKIEVELKKEIYLIEKKILPILKNNKIFTEMELIDATISKSERQQLRTLKKRYIREEIRMMKLERRYRRATDLTTRMQKFKNVVRKKPEQVTYEPLEEVGDILKKRVDVTVVLGQDDSIELVANKSGQTKLTGLANPKKDVTITDPTIKLPDLTARDDDETTQILPDQKEKKESKRQAGDDD